MKKTLALLLSAVMLLSLAGCASAGSAAETTATPAAAVETPAPVEEESEFVLAQEEINAFLDAIDLDYAYSIAETLSTDTRFHDNELGFRTAGSDAEHAAADWLAEQMEAIGLENVEKAAVSVDKWQFNGASLTIAGTDIDIMPVSYAVNGTDAEGITAEIVDVGTGFAWDYEDVDVEGKIVLCGVDQYNESWISGYMYEAYQHGAIAMVTYDIGGYGRYSDDIYQIQDVCCEDLFPSVIVTLNQYEQIAAAIEAGNNMATLIVDSEMVVDGGTGYDVIGVLKGRSSEQRILVSGHYDMYFTGFQDDCAAIGTAFGIVKGIKDSGYVPENDIVLVCSSSEEWGISGTEFDWTRGAWELINNVHPEWADSTLALFNFELSAFVEPGQTNVAISCVPEYATLVNKLVSETELLGNAYDAYFTDGIDPVSKDTTTMEDGISYREAGVPYFINVTSTCAGADTLFEETWTGLHYHTDSDDTSTYSKEMMSSNIGMFGSIAIYIDQTPAIELDLTCTCDDLEEAYDEDFFAMAGADGEAYLQNLSTLRVAAEAHNAKIADVNARYTQAAAEGAEQAALDEIRAEGVALNKITLEAFKFVQDEYLGIIFSSDVVVKHIGYMDNAMLLTGIIDALNNGNLSDDEGTGALDLAWMLNGIVEYNYYIFSPESVANTVSHVDAREGNAQLWGAERGYNLAETWQATISLLDKAEDEDADFAEELAIYETELTSQLIYMNEVIGNEILAMNGLTDILAAAK